MKLLGLIGGLSWESTTLYYQIINTEIKNRLGGLHSATLLMYSFDFQEIAALQQAGDWPQATKKMIAAGQALKSAGAEALVICTNTMHIMAKDVESATGLPLLHIADCTAAAVKSRTISTVGLLGTKFTMEHAFYKARIEEAGIKTLIPDEQDRETVHRIIYEELCQGIITPASRTRFETIIAKLAQSGAQGIILGCTEIGLLLPESECHGLPLFDTAKIHATSAAAYMLEKQPEPCA